MCFRAIDQGHLAWMGRNIFQSSAPLAMLKAVKKWFTRTCAREAFQFWQEENREKQNERDVSGDQHQA
jgi:putative autoinducer-2 (AI-2) aldolase